MLKPGLESRGERRARPAIAALLLSLELVGSLADRTSSHQAGRPHQAALSQDFVCLAEPDRRGLVRGDEIYLETYAKTKRGTRGLTLTSDSDLGRKTVISLPTAFEYDHSVLDCNSLKTPGGNFKVSMNAKLAGVIGLGRWLAVRNVVRLQICETDESGPVLVEEVLDESLATPSVHIIETAVYSPAKRPGIRSTYYIRISFHKDEGNESNDGTCGLQIRVLSL